ncbi:LysR family transcriptional regulator [Streptomyces sp. NBC_01619]|uniref:LysR family transcriptional regulator n=1 Tax=unclassified Streptomyces TaxID=2593676 RepID=UPI002255A3B7|nr:MULTISPECIES: LysR family transcriptional regulator [unclassified Streptomyces]MCX4511189.1 LysR family transcriptional regulator [Streptomyces sp. NBC_01619]
MLDVRRLRILQYLSTYGTVAAAAQALHLTAPAISQQLAALEREVGLPVVEKQGRTLRLTAVGELLVSHAEIVLSDLAAAESDLEAIRGGGHGTVRVAAFASAARTLIAPLWKRILGTGEEADVSLTLELVEQEPDAALETLRRRNVDLAVVHGYTVLPRDFPSGCEQTKLLEEPVLLALHPDHASRMGIVPGEPVDLARVSGIPWLTPGPETSCYEMTQRACGAAGFVPAIRARSGDFSVLAALVAAGAGAALLPRMTLPDATQGPISLHRLQRPVTRSVYTVSRSGTSRRPDIRHLAELLQQAAAETTTTLEAEHG